MPKITINNDTVEVAAGTSVLQACEQIGIEVPRFCYHDRLSVAANCRMCLVEIEGMPKPMASCALPCADGMKVHTTTPAVRKAREDVMEMLLANHPLDCPICDQGGECDLQDQAMAYGRDRGRFSENKRAVADKNFGAVVKTVMTRCIHCTRCIRFMDEIAGTRELAAFGRGEHLEINTVDGSPIFSELSGNIVDICPVGALTSKPYAFHARPWELNKTAGIDVMDALGCAIRIDSRGNEVMRILPRLNEAINEEWINDKTRHACDGLRYQRLDRPWLRGAGGKLHEVELTQAIDILGKKLRTTAPENIAALAGDLVACEEVYALAALMRELGVPNIDCRQDGAEYDTSSRSNYIFNTTLSRVREADAVLLIGTNPRHEATLLNVRLHELVKSRNVPIGLIGEQVDLTYPVEHLGNSAAIVAAIAKGNHHFADILRQAEKPMLIIGASALARPDGASVHALAREIANNCGLIRDNWNGFNVLQLAAARTGALDIGFLPAGNGMGTNGIINAAARGALSLLWLLGADELDIKRNDKTFIVYQGHHGDKGAQVADLILPGCAWTEKDGTYVNTEGRPQFSPRAVAAPNMAKEDWRIIRAVSESAGYTLPFNNAAELNDAMVDAHPLLGRLDVITPSPWHAARTNNNASVDPTPFGLAFNNFYMTNAIARHSPTMAKCTQELLHRHRSGKKAA